MKRAWLSPSSYDVSVTWRRSRAALLLEQGSDSGRRDDASVEMGMGMARHRRVPAKVERKPSDTTVREPEAVRIGLLGGFRVSVGNRTIEEGAWRLRKAASLVKLLALARGHRLHRERVMDLLWPELGAKAASNNLRQVLHIVRRTLASDTSSPRYLELQGDQLVICPSGKLWVDVNVFEGTAATARRSRSPIQRSQKGGSKTLGAQT